jgi:iron complex transport system permease protein
VEYALGVRSVRGFAVLASLVALVAAVAVGVAYGSSGAGLADLFAGGTPAHGIVVGVRLPRVLLAVVAGAGLAAVGAAFQSVLRNPLAEPFMLGVSGGAALGATAAIALGVGASLVGAAAIPVAAFLGGLAATAVVWTIVRVAGAGGASILLAGIVVNAIAAAGITLIEAVADPGQLQSLLWWLMGYLRVPSWPKLAFVAAYVTGGVGVLLFDAARMNVLALGDEAAATLGVDVRALQRRTILACSVAVGAIVSITGLVGFVGLVVPQAMRRVVGPDLRVLLPASIFAGGATLALCDTIVRVLAPRIHTEIPVGAVTALAGGPVFLVLLLRSRRGAS